MRSNCSIRKSPSSPRRGFTLVEVLVSLALVLMVVFGISQVFKMSTDATGAAQAVSAGTRQHQAAFGTMADDFKNMLVDSPVFTLTSRVGNYSKTPPPGSTNCGFRNLADHMSDPDGDPDTIYLNGTNFVVPVPSLNDRIPRLDTVSFMARGSYRRQTWPVNTATSNVTSSEAYIWIGHLNRVLPGSGGYLAPENTYAFDRILGRAVILMKDPSSIPAKEPFWQDAGYGMTPITPGVAQNLTPLGPNSALQTNGTSADNGAGYNKSIFGARYDLAGSTIDKFRQTVDVAFANRPGDWYTPLTANRFYCQPVLTRPITAEKLAYTTPIFAPNCTQFVVEYAGDFLAQNPDGSIATNPATGQLGVSQYINAQGAIVNGYTDGQVDFYYDKLTQSRKVRWYGLPRDTDGDGRIVFYGVGGARLETSDVVPFADVIRMSGIPALARSCGPWEYFWPLGTGKPSNGYDYMQSWKNLGTGRDNFRYVCAFRNQSPIMIRVLMKLDDPTGKLADGQWFEYVFSR